MEYKNCHCYNNNCRTDILFLYRYQQKNKENGRDERKHVENVSLKLTDILNNLFLIKSYQTEQQELEKVCSQSDNILMCRSRLLKDMTLYWGKIYICNVIGFILAFLIMLQEIREGKCAVGEILVAYTYLENIFSAMRNVSRYKTDIYNADASLCRVFELIEDDREVRERNVKRTMRFLKN